MILRLILCEFLSQSILLKNEITETKMTKTDYYVQLSEQRQEADNLPLHRS